MRNVDRLLGIKLAIDALAGQVDGLFHEATQERLGESDRIVKAISEIQPAKVDLTQELADDIVRKIHGPLTIPKQFSEWVAEQAQFHDIVRIDPLGYGPHAATVQYVLKSDGTLYVEFRDLNGATLWRGTFVPPGFGT